MQDAHRLRLVSYDHERDEYFLAVPVEIEMERTDQRGRVSSIFSQSAPPGERAEEPRAGTRRR